MPSVGAASHNWGTVGLLPSQLSNHIPELGDAVEDPYAACPVGLHHSGCHYLDKRDSGCYGLCNDHGPVSSNDWQHTLYGSCS